MASDKDYSKMTLDELVSEEKKLKSQKTTTALFMGFLVGIEVWAAIQGKWFLTFMLLLAVLYIGSSYTKTLKKVREEISRRDKVS